jgi:hypothetical protein
VDILRFVMAYSSSLHSDPGSARLAKKLQTLQRGRAGPFSRHWPATNQYIAAAEVMLLNGHKAPTVHRPLLAARVLSRLKARADADSSFWLNTLPSGHQAALQKLPLADKGISPAGFAFSRI